MKITLNKSGSFLSQDFTVSQGPHCDAAIQTLEWRKFFDFVLIRFLCFKNVIFLLIDSPLWHALSSKTLKNLPDLLTEMSNSPEKNRPPQVREGKREAG